MEDDFHLQVGQVWRSPNGRSTRKITAIRSVPWCAPLRIIRFRDQTGGVDSSPESGFRADISSWTLDDQRPTEV